VNDDDKLAEYLIGLEEKISELEKNLNELDDQDHGTIQHLLKEIITLKKEDNTIHYLIKNNAEANEKDIAELKERLDTNQIDRINEHILIEKILWDVMKKCKYCYDFEKLDGKKKRLPSEQAAKCSVCNDTIFSKKEDGSITCDARCKDSGGEKAVDRKHELTSGETSKADKTTNSKPPERFMYHITHCPKCDGRVEVKCDIWQSEEDEKKLILEFVKKLESIIHRMPNGKIEYIGHLEMDDIIKEYGAELK